METAQHTTLLSKAQVAARLGMHPVHLMRVVDKLGLTPIRLYPKANRVFFDGQEVEELIERRLAAAKRGGGADR